MQNASDGYFPKPNFGVRKFWVWLILGPVNPISWILIFYFERSPNLFSVTAFATLWPCALGAAIGLWRLKRRHIHSFYLAGFVSTWAFLTIPIYTFVVACLGSVYFSILDAGKLEIAQLQIIPLGFAYGLFMLPFALIFGMMPAMTAAILSYWMIRWFLFYEESPTPSAISSSGVIDTEQGRLFEAKRRLVEDGQETEDAPAA